MFSPVQTVEMQISEKQKSRLQDFRKSEGNYNNISNNELRKNDFNKGQKPYRIYF